MKNQYGNPKLISKKNQDTPSLSQVAYKNPDSPIRKIENPAKTSHGRTNMIPYLFSLEDSIQFSPVRVTKSPDPIIKDKDSTAASILTPSLLSKSPSKTYLSYIRFIKSQSPKTFKTTTGLKKAKIASPTNFTTRMPSNSASKFSKNRIEDDRFWRKIINLSNGIDSQPSFFASYTVFIGKGNNSSLVRKIFSSRNWWSITDNKDKANFVWTQWKDKAFLSSLPSAESTVHTVDPCQSLLLKLAKPSTSIQELITTSAYTALLPQRISSESSKMHNKLESNNFLSNKKEMYLTLKDFYTARGENIFEKVPLTFQVNFGESDEEFINFTEKFNEYESYKGSHMNFHNIWIVKPGEFTNRGQGIKVCRTIKEIADIIHDGEHSYIIQKYIENPLLFNKRKFDIRCYALVTRINGVMQAYFYLDGYLRTTSQEFNIKDTSNVYVHLTNDAIQKHAKDYGRYENGNKLSYKDFQRYLDRKYPEKKVKFCENILPEIKSMVRDTILASFNKLDPGKRMNSMEIFGYDFMVDRQLKPWLIEINTNPCLELSSKYLNLLIPRMLENALKIAVDTLFVPPVGEYIEFPSENRFELIFHEFNQAECKQGNL